MATDARVVGSQRAYRPIKPEPRRLSLVKTEAARG